MFALFQLELFIPLLVVATICALLCASVASAKDLSPVWGLSGFLFGPLALIAVAGMPDRRQRMFLRFLAEKQGWLDQQASSHQQEDVSPDLAAQQRAKILGK
jgi:hypothetical protein